MRDWVKIGYVAAEFVGSEEQGAKLLRETQLADALGISRATLRSYATAATFLSELGSRGLHYLADQLMNEPAVAVNALRRWSRYDFEGMLGYAHRRSPLRVRELLEAESAARKLQGRKPAGDLLLSAYEEQVRSGHPHFAPTLQRQSEAMGVPLPRWSSLSIKEARSPYLRWCGVSYVLSAPDQALEAGRGQPQAGEGAGVVGFITVKTAKLPELYRREARKLYLGAAAAAAILPVVVIACLDERAPQEILRSIIRPSETAGSDSDLLLTSSRTGIVVITHIKDMVKRMSS